ncbi:MAG: DUF4332 domain-containing protein [Bacteroidetes bacterium]|nr:DUF4332 domain-containing protein [Bacteroidota bacterium]
MNHFKEVIENDNKIILHENIAEGDTTYSLFTFNFVAKGGTQLNWYEVIKRQWKDGLVVDEEYIVADTAEEAKFKFDEMTAHLKVAVPAKKKAVKKAPKKAAPKKTVAKKATPKKAATKKVADNLKKIEGIGPKIAQILTEAGIDTFAKVAKTKPEKISSILLNVHKRYRIHDPATWPAQAKLAAAGKWDELKKWQGDLKGGK